MDSENSINGDSKVRSQAFHDCVKAHIDRLILDGSVVIGQPNNPRDLKKYLQSGEFAKYQTGIQKAVSQTLTQ